MVIWYMDFDGVFNFELSRNKVDKYRKLTGNVFGWLLSRKVYYNGFVANANFSSELVKKMHTLEKTSGSTWLWLTTWFGHTDSVDFALNRMPEHDAVPWVPLFGGNVDDRIKINGAAKYAALKKHHDGVTPFIWVDDDATVNFNPDDFTVPHLVVTPDANYGISVADYDKIVAFVNLHS